MNLAITATDARILNLHTRIPFRYGIAAMTAVPHLVLRAQVRIDGRTSTGFAADHLPPKWFTKDPQSPYQRDVVDMIGVIDSACRFARDAGAADRHSSSPFELWRQVYTAQEQWAAGTKHPPLLWNFGVSLIERAMLDAVLRDAGVPLWRAMRSDLLGMDLGALHPELADARPADLLPLQPARRVHVRHTVGLSDPLTAADLPGQRLDDGLPETLEEAITQNGLSRLKIKLCGDAAKDLQRLRDIAELVSRVMTRRCAFTLDGNEQYNDLGALRELFERIGGDPKLKSFMHGLLFLEQPLHRDVALTDATGAALRQWTHRPPVIIDESDADLSSLPRALACGYVGTSHKNCKGIFKSIANACLLEHLRRTRGGSFIQSGEDLSNVGIALLQDLAAAAALGIDDLERNGQHYFRGASQFPPAWQEQLLAKHGDVYAPLPGGLAAVAITDGMLSVDSAVDAPFGLAFEPQLDALIPADRWRFESLA